MKLITPIEEFNLLKGKDFATLECSFCSKIYLFYVEIATGSLITGLSSLKAFLLGFHLYNQVGT